MGNAAILYDRKTIDLGAQGVIGVLGGRTFEGSRVFAGASQTTVLRSYQAIEIQKRFSDRTLYQSIQTFWHDWALQGRPFSFAFDSAKTMDAPIMLDPLYGNMLDNGDMEVWASATAATGWIFTIAGGTSIDRETKREDVQEGLYAMRWTLSGASQSTAAINSYRQLALSVPFKISFWQKDSAGIGMDYSVQNVTSGLWAQNTTPTWGAGQVWLATGAINTVEWALYSQTFNSGLASTGTVKIVLRNQTTGSVPHLVDDLRLERTAGTVRVRSATGLVNTDVVRFVSRTEPREELVTVSSFASAGLGMQDLTLSALPRGRFDMRDIVREEDYYPYLLADQKDEAVVENAGGVFDLSLKCRDSLTGRD